MAAQSVSLSTMFGWIPEAFRMLRQGKGPLLAASLWMILVVVLISAPIFVYMGFSGAFNPQTANAYLARSTFWVIEAFVILISVLVHPALIAGWYRLIGATAVGTPGRGRDIFAPFADAALWGRCLRVALIGIAAVAVLFCAMLLPFASQFFAFQHAAQANQAAIAAGMAGIPVTFPTAMFMAYIAFILLAIGVQSVATIALGEVAARPTPAATAMLESLQAIARNFFKLLLFNVCVGILFSALFMVILIPLVLIGVALAMISPILMLIVVGLGYLAMFLAMYPIMYVFFYLYWRDLLGGATPPPIPASVSV